MRIFDPGCIMYVATFLTDGHLVSLGFPLQYHYVLSIVHAGELRGGDEWAQTRSVMRNAVMCGHPGLFPNYCMTITSTPGCHDPWPPASRRRREPDTMDQNSEENWNEEGFLFSVFYFSLFS
jgi:hypothetical protein